MNTLAPTLIAIAAGGALLVNGIFLNADDVINEAQRVTNETNVHQLATILELYYLDHDTYPDVSGGEALIESLYRNGYLLSKPRDAKIFTYEPRGDTYYLAITDQK